MIVRILSRGKSFQGCATYLTHDAEADTAERVGWTHTLNCANDHVPSAVNEMVWTARDAELLKQEAGIRAGGRPTENTVKHLSLNWSPDENPSREHMIATTEDFLRHMGWEEHQAVLVSHTDKSYAHLHVMLNVIHPETGLKLDDNFERRRSQEWAKEYEREHGIYCENRLLPNIGEREPSPTRPAWMAFQGVRRDFEETEKNRAAEADRISEINPELTGTQKEWAILKNNQREERLAFFAEGKMAFSEMRNSVFSEVREEFREKWADYYSAKKDGADSDTLKEMKATLVNEQKTVLEERRDEAYRGLRETRDGLYQELLAGQREKRQDLTLRQAGQFESLEIMDWFRTEIPRERNDYERTETDVPSLGDEVGSAYSYADSRGNAGMRSEADAGSRLADGFATGILAFFDFAANAFSPPTAEPPKAHPVDDIFAQAAADTRLLAQIDRDRSHTEEEEEERRARARPQQ